MARRARNESQDFFNHPTLGSAIDQLESPGASLASLSITVWAAGFIPEHVLDKAIFDTDGEGLGTVKEWHLSQPLP